MLPACPSKLHRDRVHSLDGRALLHTYAGVPLSRFPPALHFVECVIRRAQQTLDGFAISGVDCRTNANREPRLLGVVRQAVANAASHHTGRLCREQGATPTDPPDAPHVISANLPCPRALLF
jgi:hypothetical protein